MRLVILDINGLLCRKTTEGKVDLSLGRYGVVIRPGAREFLEFCYQNFDVGIFSSTTYKNASPILEALLTPEQQKKTKFKWFRDRSSIDPDYNSSGRRAEPSWDLDEFIDKKIEQYSTVKKIADVLSAPQINEDRKYTLQNTLIVDDSPMKMRFNQKKNVVLIAPFEKEDDLLFTLGDELLRRFEGL